MSRATSIAAEPAASGSWTKTAKSWAVSSMALRPRPTSPSAATTGKPSISRAATISAPPKSRSRACRFPLRKGKEQNRADSTKLWHCHCEERSRDEAISTPQALSGPEIASLRSPWQCASNLHFADLNCRLDVGVVGNIGHDHCRVRAKGRLKIRHRVEIEMAH